MAYFINLFSPETYQAFSLSARDVTGFREKQRSRAASLEPGDRLICYMTKLSRWVGVLEVLSDSFQDDTPIFTEPPDPFCTRFKVRADVWLDPEQTLPIREDLCWKHLSFTRSLKRGDLSWTGRFRGSLGRLSEEDGRYLETLLRSQQQSPNVYPLTPADQRKYQSSLVNAERGQIPVSIPGDEEANATNTHPSATEHLQMQAYLAEIGAQMGFRIWLPRGDRQRVLALWHPSSPDLLLERLPLNFDSVTLRIIENIDVLWIRRHAIVHAFEVEHTTSIYSGLLRMADLMALQPNLSIHSHIVAPTSRRSKVLQEISRPIFALMEKGPMSESCSYLPYEEVISLRNERNLQHLSDSVLEEYVEYAQDTDF